MTTTPTTVDTETTIIRRVIFAFLAFNVAMFAVLLLGAEPSSTAESEPETFDTCANHPRA